MSEVDQTRVRNEGKVVLQGSIVFHRGSLLCFIVFHRGLLLCVHRVPSCSIVFHRVPSWFIVVHRGPSCSIVFHLLSIISPSSSFLSHHMFSL